MSLESLKEGFANQVIYQKWKQKENNHFQANYWVTKLYLHLRPSIYSIQQIKLCFSQLQATSTMSSITMDLVNWLSVHCCTVSCAVRMWRLKKRQQQQQKTKTKNYQRNTISSCKHHLSLPFVCESLNQIWWPPFYPSNCSHNIKFIFLLSD